MQSLHKYAFSLLALSVVGMASAEYKIEYLSAASYDAKPIPYAVNKSGTAVGIIYRTFDPGATAAVWANGSQTELPGDFNQSAALDIADDGTIVGYGIKARTDLSTPVIWKDGNVTELISGDFGGTVFAINNSGTLAAGFIRDGKGNRPTIWENGVPRELPIPVSNGYASGEVRGINDAGDVVGYYFDFGTYKEIPCVWRNGILKELPFPFTDYVTAGRINNAGLVTGYGTFAGDPNASWPFGPQRGAIWNANDEISLLENGNNDTAVAGITAAGLVVGSIYTDQFERIGGTFQDGSFSPLPVAEGESGIPTDVAEDGTTIVGYTHSAEGIRAVKWTNSSDSIDVSAPAAFPGDQIPVEGKVIRNGRPAVNKYVIFQVDGKRVGSARTDARGIAKVTYQVPTNVSRNYQEVMASLGGSNYAIRRSTVRAYPTRVTTWSTAAKAGSIITMRASLQNTRTGSWPAGKTLSFEWAGRRMGTAVTDSQGIATFKLQLSKTAKPGTYSYQVKFAGDTMHEKAEKALKVTITN